MGESDEEVQAVIEGVRAAVGANVPLMVQGMDSLKQVSIQPNKSPKSALTSSMICAAHYRHPPHVAILTYWSLLIYCAYSSSHRRPCSDSRRARGRG